MGSYLPHDLQSRSAVPHQSLEQFEILECHSGENQRKYRGMLLLDSQRVIMDGQGSIAVDSHNHLNICSNNQSWHNNNYLQALIQSGSGITSPGLYSPFEPSPSYPSQHDYEEWQSQSSDTRSHSVVNPDDMPAPNTITQAYYPSYHHSWNTTAYAPAVPTLLSNALPTGIFVAPIQVEHVSTHAPDVAISLQHEDASVDVMSEDLDAEGEDDDSVMDTEGLTGKKWSSLQSHLSPYPRNNQTGPPSEDQQASDAESEYKPVKHHRKTTNGKQDTITTRSGRRSSRPQLFSSKSTDPVSTSRGIKKSKSNSWSKKAAAAVADGATRPFFCPWFPYGCSSTFPNKNEWKRHTTTQHMKLGIWRCSDCPKVEGTNNDFNRKDLFRQHIQRMHRENLEIDLTELSTDLHRQLEASKHEKQSRKEKEYHKGKDRNNMHYWIHMTTLQKYDDDCWIQLRELPQSCICPICNNKDFQGPTAWDDRMEHMAGHFQKVRGISDNTDSISCEPQYWKDDIELQDYLEQEGLISRDASGAWKFER